MLAQSPGSALPQLLSGDHHLRSVVLLRRSLLQRSAQRLHAGLRAAAGRGHRAAHVVRVKGRWGGLCPRCGGRDGCGEDAGSRSPPLRSRRRSVAAIRFAAAPRCGWHGALPAARFGLRQDGQSRAAAAALLCAAPSLYLVPDGAFPSITHTTRRDLAPSPLPGFFLLTFWKTGYKQLGSFFFVATIIGVWWDS